MIAIAPAPRDTKPKSAQPVEGKLTPVINEFINNYLTEIGPDDPNAIADYKEMVTTCPPIKAAVKTINLLGVGCVGEYQHDDPELAEWVNKNFDGMRGSLNLSLAQSMSAIFLGWSCSEIALKVEGDQWLLDSLLIMDPEYYNFRGTVGEIDDILYHSAYGRDIPVPYDRVLHIVNNPEFAFNSPFGVSDLRAAAAAWKAWKIVVAELMVGTKRKATGLLHGQYDPEAPNVTLLDSDGNPMYGDDGEPVTIHPADELAQALSQADSSTHLVTSTRSQISNIASSEGFNVFFDALRYLHKLMFLALLFPETALEVVGVGEGSGDSNLNKGQMGLLGQSVSNLMHQITDQVIEKVVRPLIVWNFGEQENYGHFAEPPVEADNKIEWFNALVSAMTQGFFLPDNLDVVNKALELAGLPPVEEPAAEDTELSQLARGVDYWLQTYAKSDQGEVERLLIEIINETYRDEVESIESYELEDDTFTGIALDQVSRAHTARIAFEIGPETIVTWLDNPDEAQTFSTFAKAKKRNCKVGKSFPCGNSCQPLYNKSGTQRKCHKKMTKKQQQLHAQSLTAAQGAASTPTSSTPATPSTSPAASTSSAPTQDFIDLQDAIANKDFDAMAEAASKIYDKGKLQAQKDGSNFYRDTRGGNGTTDPLMTTLLIESGFNGKPTAISKAKMDALDPKGNLLIYRNPSRSNFANRFQQFKDGDPEDYTSGRGIYCSGTYVAANYRGTKNMGKAALSAAQGYGTGTMKMAMDRNNANIVKQSKIEADQDLFRQNLNSWRGRQLSSFKPTQAEINNELIVVNSLKPRITKGFSLFGDTDYDVELVDPNPARMGQGRTGPKYQTTNITLTKSSSQSKPWSVNGSTDQYKTRKEALAKGLELEAERRATKTAQRNNPKAKEIEKKYRRIYSVAIGGDKHGASGRFAILNNVDFMQLDNAYDSTYGLLLNRSKTIVQSTKASSTVP